MSAAQRRLYRELADLMGKHLTVITVDGKSFTGMLVGIDPETLTLCLNDVSVEGETNIPKVFINGNVINRILAIEKPFDLRSLAERLEKVFPTMIDVSNIDKGFIWVMGKIKVTEEGVVEGSGPAAERVKRVYDLFVREKKS